MQNALCSEELANAHGVLLEFLDRTATSKTHPACLGSSETICMFNAIRWHARACPELYLRTPPTVASAISRERARACPELDEVLKVVGSHRPPRVRR
mmetsp:Transcript_35096/g.101071  ORF Transcript_35096/g.101071 Transcript_35096/m.101071 type:complete len:97 (+) Transcript_35096:3866-4156(+)